MAATVTLRNRIPEIAALELPQRAAALTLAAAEITAAGARQRAPIGATGDLEESIEAKPWTTGNEVTQAAAVVAIFYWFFNEFGTRFQSARPFMIPAAEQARISISRLAREVFVGL